MELSVRVCVWMVGALVFTRWQHHFKIQTNITRFSSLEKSQKRYLVSRQKQHSHSIDRYLPQARQFTRCFTGVITFNTQNNIVNWVSSSLFKALKRLRSSSKVHTAWKWQSWESNTGLSDSRTWSLVAGTTCVVGRHLHISVPSPLPSPPLPRSQYSTVWTLNSRTSSLLATLHQATHCTSQSHSFLVYKMGTLIPIYRVVVRIKYDEIIHVKCLAQYLACG